jgi:alpha-tubulin suppressor-like RCC1 family protein
MKKIGVVYILSSIFNLTYAQCWKEVYTNTLSTLAICTDGSLWGLGNNTNGVFGNGTVLSSNIPIKINEINPWKKISNGGSFIIAINNDGTLWSWGNDQGIGVLGNNGQGSKTSPYSISTDNTWKDVVCGSYYSLALKNDGSLWAWGFNFYGRTGILNATGVVRLPTKVNNFNWVAIGTSDQASYGIKDDGSLWAWGNNSSGQLGDSTLINKFTPIRIGFDSDWKSIMGGDDRVLAIKQNGSLWSWGFNRNGNFGDNSITSKIIPTKIGIENNWAKILSVSDLATFALKEDQSIWGWGKNLSGLVDSTVNGDIPLPRKLNYGNDIIEIGNKISSTYFLSEKGTFSVIGPAKGTYVSNGKLPMRFNQVGSNSNWIDISSGDAASIALNSQDQMFVWGITNIYSLKGDGSVIENIKYPELTVASNINKIQAGYSTFFHIKNDGTLWGWGNNQSLAIGADALSFFTNTRSGNLNDLKSVSSKFFHTLVLQNNGNLYGWGLNSNGECGQGTFYPNIYQGFIGGGFQSGSTGLRFSGGIKNDGSLWMWGKNDEGQLGDGTYLDRNLPVRIGIDNNWKELSLGTKTSIALKYDGSIWAWGNNVSSQYGNGNFIQRNYPVRVGNDNDWKKIEHYDSFTLALKNNGTLWGWGGNFGGRFGNGTSSNSIPIPTQIGTDNDWQKISLGVISMALKTNGTLWTSGNDAVVGYNYLNVIPVNLTCPLTGPVPCPNYRFHDNFSSESQIITSQNKGLIVSRKIVGSGNVVTYNSPVTVLKPGFVAENGSIFKVVPNGCQ